MTNRFFLTVLLIKLNNFSSILFSVLQEQNPNKDRVTAFLDSASGYVPLPDLSSINQPPTGHNPAFNSPTHASDKTAAPYFEFRVEPHFKEAFLTLFRMAKNKMNGRGFPL